MQDTLAREAAARGLPLTDDQLAQFDAYYRLLVEWNARFNLTRITDYDAVRMYDVNLVEQVLGVKVGDRKPDEYVPAEPYEEYFSEGGGYRHMGNGSRIKEKMNAEERAIIARAKG